VYLDRKSSFYFASIVMIAGGALAWYFVLIPLLRLLGVYL
jgi:hypothetical protein